MNSSKSENNQVYICGEIVEGAKFSCEIMGENFYDYKIKIARLSEQSDILPVTISERVLLPTKSGVGDTLSAYGQLRSYNKIVDGKSKLMLSVFVQNIASEEDSENPNQIALCGYVCKKPVYRITPMNREIADILLAVNRSYGKTDYIPCIAWGRNAEFAERLSVGDAIFVFGRIQSREYKKELAESVVETRTAYEVSLRAISTTDKFSLSTKDA